MVNYLKVTKGLENNKKIIKLTKKFNKCEDKLVKIDNEIDDIFEEAGQSIKSYFIYSN
jgi:hypothetical protein